MEFKKHKSWSGILKISRNRPSFLSKVKIKWMRFLLVFEKGEILFQWKSKNKTKTKKNLHHFRVDKHQNSDLNKQTKPHCHQIHPVKFYDLNSFDWNSMINRVHPVTVNNKLTIKIKLKTKNGEKIYQNISQRIFCFTTLLQYFLC